MYIYQNRIVESPSFIQQDYTCCSCICCGTSCSCYCIGSQRGCTCHLDPNVHLTIDTIFTEIKGTRVPYTQLAIFFDFMFPNQIAALPKYLNKNLTFDYKNITVQEAIKCFSLQPLTKKLIPRRELQGPVNY